jgi:CBS domain-containing protein
MIAIKDRGDRAMQAKDVMSTPAVVVHPHTPVVDVAKRMLEHRISGVPVVDDHGRLLGIVSEGDLVARVDADSRRHHSWWLDLIADRGADAAQYIKSHGRTAADVMTRQVVTVGERTPLSRVAALIERHHIKRVPVVRNERVVGIVSRANLLHGLAAERQSAGRAATSDRKLRVAVLNEIDRAGIDRSHVNVVVSNGIVELWGFVDTDLQRRALAVAARNVDGVKKVADRTSVLTPLLRGAMGSQ